MINRTWAITSVIFLSSCISLSKQEQTHNLLTPPSIESSVEDSLNASFFSLGNWPEESWWKVFQSSELDSLMLKAIEANPSIQSIEQRIEFAKQSAKIARSKLFPLIFFDATDTWEYLSHNGLYRQLNPTIPLNVNLIDLTFSFTYEFDFWGKYRNLFKAAIGLQRSQEAESQQVKLITTTALAGAYFALKTNLVRKQLYEELLEVRQNILDLQNLLVVNLLLSKLPPLLSEENLLEAHKLIASIDEEIAVDRHLINILMGAGPDEPLDIHPELPLLPASLNIPDNLSIDLLSRRPDLMAQIWKVEALAHEVGAAKADFFPNVNLLGFMGLESAISSVLFNHESQTTGLKPAIHLPIFTAGAIRANIRGKKALFDQAVFDYNNLILKSFQEVSDILAFSKSIYKQKEDQSTIVENASARYELILLREKHGLDNALTRLAFYEELIEKELIDVNLLYSQYLATIKLTKALGGGYTSEYSVPLKAQEIPSP